MSQVRMWFTMAILDRTLFPVSNNMRPHKVHPLGWVVNECERVLNLEARRL